MLTGVCFNNDSVSFYYYYLICDPFLFRLCSVNTAVRETFTTWLRRRLAVASKCFVNMYFSRKRLAVASKCFVNMYFSRRRLAVASKCFVNMYFSRRRLAVASKCFVNMYFSRLNTQMHIKRRVSINAFI